MNRRLRLLVLFLLLALSLAACGKDDEGTEAVVTPDTVTTAPTLAPADTAVPLPTSTPLPPPTATALPPATETPTATPVATGQVDTTGQGDAAGQGQQDPAAAGTAAAAAGMMATWQGLMNIAVLNQGLCTTLQGLAQSGQQGGLGALAVGAGLLGAGSLLQSMQQQLAGLMGLSGLGPLLGSLQADQTAMSDIITRWSGGQLDATGAGAALQTVCGATNTTLSQTQQSAQDSGLSEEQVSGMMEQSKQEAAGSLGGLRR